MAKAGPTTHSRRAESSSLPARHRGDGARLGRYGGQSVLHHPVSAAAPRRSLHRCSGAWSAGMEIVDQIQAWDVICREFVWVSERTCAEGSRGTRWSVRGFRNRKRGRTAAPFSRRVRSGLSVSCRPSSFPPLAFFAIVCYPLRLGSWLPTVEGRAGCRSGTLGPSGSSRRCGGRCAGARPESSSKELVSLSPPSYQM